MQSSSGMAKKHHYSHKVAETKAEIWGGNDVKGIGCVEGGDPEEERTGCGKRHVGWREGSLETGGETGFVPSCKNVRWYGYSKGKLRTFLGSTMYFKGCA